MTLDDVIASRGGIPLIEDGKLIGAIGCSGATGSQDEVVCSAGAATIRTDSRGLHVQKPIMTPFVLKYFLLRKAGRVRRRASTAYQSTSFVPGHWPGLFFADLRKL